ncbi:nucleotidyltransferase domain-containing protein [Methanobacterium congolense]|uniref:protein adenylyltransferase n=1 Tax=Methanobacterium congolense TaxID=118062 RepID=A0A1D3L1N9_9EURY|nr:nucleotidyltransferase domain-containing protein [Methanobacterium congolense]SCG85409.1 DNA polymerase beta domain protein region [Methanobacterium congolense]
MQNIKRYRITDIQRKKVVGTIRSVLMGKNEILFAYIHGSFLQNQFRDVDLAIYLDEDITKKEALHFELSLERELEESSCFPADVRTLNYSPLSFKFNSFKDGNLLMSRDEVLRSDFESLTMNEYHDFNFYRKRYMKEVFGLD